MQSERRAFPGSAGLQPGSRSHAGAWRSQEQPWRTGSGLMKQTSSRAHACVSTHEHPDTVLRARCGDRRAATGYRASPRWAAPRRGGGHPAGGWDCSGVAGWPGGGGIGLIDRTESGASRLRMAERTVQFPARAVRVPATLHDFRHVDVRVEGVELRQPGLVRVGREHSCRP